MKGLKKINTGLAVGGLSLVLVACGGGGGGGSSAAAPTTTTGSVNVQLTDGPSDNFSHVWVTIKAISFHSDANQTWSAGDATWHTKTLSAPVTIDLASLTNGSLNNLFRSMNLPVGTYRQIRLFFVGADDTLTTSAQATLDSNNTALQYNDQVEYTDATGFVREAPLEIAYPLQGVQLNGSFDVSATKPIDIAVDFDLENIIVPFRHDGDEAFTMRPTLRYFDLSDAGAIIGKVDAGALCPAGAMPPSSCAYNLVVKAERLTPDGSRHYEARATTVRGDGSFALFPLPAHDASGNAISYDVVVRGRQMETLLITGVPVTLGTTPGANPTNLTPVGVLPIAITTEYDAQFSVALHPLTSGWALFQQTLPATAQVPVPVPYEIRVDSTDPFTGLLFNNRTTNGGVALVNGPVHVGAYNAGSAVSLTAVAPSEGAGGYAVATNEAAYYALSSDTLLSAPVSGATQAFAPPTPTLVTGVSAGTVTGNIAVTNAAGFDHGQFVIVHFASIVTSDEADIDRALQNHGGTYTIAGLPAGSASTSVPGAYYYAYLRLWKTGAHHPARIIPVNDMIDLRNTNAVSGINVTIP